MEGDGRVEVKIRREYVISGQGDKNTPNVINKIERGRLKLN